ncbi:VWA domain-containing protein [soil metagenome]
MQGLFKRFRRDVKGTVAITFALAALPVFLSIGVAVDFVQASALKSKLQSSLDAAALAAASSKSLSNSKRLDMARAVFAKNWKDRTHDDSKLEVTPDFTIRNGVVLASADVAMPTAFMRIAGLNSLDLGSDVSVTIPNAKNAEVALVLDYSSSMNEVSGSKVKYIAMRDAAQDLVTDLKAEGKNRVKIGLVPFSQQVYVTLPKAYVKGEIGGGSWTGCTVDRQYSYNITDTTPVDSDDDSKWNQAPSNRPGANTSCTPYAARGLKVRELTDDLDGVANQLSVMKPYDYTNISLGAEFGWHLLSPNAPFAAASYGDTNTKKYLVILTDGRQTEYAFGAGGKRSAKEGEKNLTAICGAAKAKGITIVTIAFDMDDPATANRLRNCATDPDKDYFDADNDADVASAFDEIKAQIASQVYVSK